MSIDVRSLSDKWLLGLEAALRARWPLVSAVLTDKIGEAFFRGAFQTPGSTWAYITSEWWTVLVSAVVSVFVGGVVRAQGKVNYLERVEAGTEPPPAKPVVVPQGTTVITAPPAAAPPKP